MEYKIKEMSLEELEPRVIEGLLEHKERLGYDIPKSDAVHIGFAALNEYGEIVGGVTAKISYGELHVSLLSVDQNTQGSGVGSELMAQIERYGRANNCHHISLTTFSYQAPEFYEKCGFTELGRVKDFPIKGEEKFFFIKYL
ncbi:GNAT family N-acetyltransferase [Listeria monocytogenes]|uniref:GNAT family N-acetyltransferase n=1 Tax=Listeria monocytogenes TaxID=1639 RepID=A0AB74NCY0_LISMN|nr:GNAT family N-acetyltransferase [Listeria monocytogenes]EAE3600415.1 GNAT family N-acetyltransferase [Listeria monocytogenes]EAE3607415.1 GNAT family N-acetyltransferase [Listeria monocytogenes]EAE3621252.1 GNAT family N-acetyltransferase [Listeria monocytogenes]EAE3650980.1 GNAT family N-acetyltransferase [Listeria monocytogenes]EAE3672967.1 GNAT family N-acetyltransferase [Listeria monocytogenes]